MRPSPPYKPSPPAAPRRRRTPPGQPPSQAGDSTGAARHASGGAPMSLTSGPVPTWGDGGGHLELIAMLRRQVSDRLAATGRGEPANADNEQADRDQRVAELVEQVLDENTPQRLAPPPRAQEPPARAAVGASQPGRFPG